MSVNLDSEPHFSISLGETKSLSVISNPTTGYRWEVVSTGSEFCQVISDEYVRDNVAPGICGAGGTQVFKLLCDTQAQVGSSHVLKLEYKRSWEPQGVKTIEVSYTISS
jgi:predicted secreted protein